MTAGRHVPSFFGARREGGREGERPGDFPPPRRGSRRNDASRYAAGYSGYKLRQFSSEQAAPSSVGLVWRERQQGSTSPSPDKIGREALQRLLTQRRGKRRRGDLPVGLWNPLLRDASLT